MVFRPTKHARRLRSPRRLRGRHQGRLEHFGWPSANAEPGLESAHARALAGEIRRGSERLVGFFCPGLKRYARRLERLAEGHAMVRGLVRTRDDGHTSCDVGSVAPPDDSNQRVADGA